ncbi:MAG: hypothetical protein IJ007_02305 [Oscillospiraceae bacterium]|nr:hypothetical protein [Oscillospiraceae bacterium]
MARNFDYGYEEKKRVSAFSVIEVIVIILLILVIIAMVAFNVLFRKDNEATGIFGYSFYKTRAVNMVPEIPVNTVIIAKKSEIPNIKEKSVILCNIGEHTALTRVVDIQEENGQKYYIVKFDTSPANETFRVEGDAVIAKAIWQLEAFGEFLDFATSAPGIIIAIIIPLGIIIIFQIIRIKNIKELEREASSIDDIDDMMLSRRKSEPPAVTFTQPKFDEDITDKESQKKRDIPAVSPRSFIKNEAPAFTETAEKPKAKLTVDARGKADFGVTDKNDAAPAYSSASVSRANLSQDDLYLNRPTRIEPAVTDESPVNALKSGNDKVIFTPHLSNIIPDKITEIQNGAASSFDESVKTYFEKEKPKPKAEAPVINDTAPVSTIPENAVVPKENIAPARKKKSSKTLEELMSIIDAEESKLKK